MKRTQEDRVIHGRRADDRWTGAGPVSRQQHRFVAANSEIPGQGRTCADDQVRTTQSVGRHVAMSRSLCGTQR